MKTRSLFGRLALVGVIAAVTVLLVPGAAMATEVQNGSFETGDATGWTIADSAGSASTWEVASGTLAPESENEIFAPSCGDYQAVYDNLEAGSSILYQDIVVDANATSTLTFTHWFINYAVEPPAVPTAIGAAAVPDAAGDPLWASPSSLNYSPGTEANQQYRVDIIDPAADPFSVAGSDVWLSVFGTQPGDPASMAPVQVSVDVSQFAGKTIRLRFAAVNNRDDLNVGVDCVSVDSVPVTTTTTEATTTTSTAALAVATPRFTG